MRIVVMPMAGKGLRISPISECKVLTPIGELKKPMFLYSLDHVGVSFDKIIFITQKKHKINLVTKKWLNQFITYDIIEIDRETAGPLDTISEIGSFLSKCEDEVLIINSDQVVDWPGDWALEWFKRKGATGGIPTVERSSPRHSYVKIDPNVPHKVIDIAEKKIISNRATIGFYWFAKGKTFWEAAKKVLENPEEKVNDEYYVSSVYKYLDGLTLEFPICDFWSIGEPKNLESYLSGKNQTSKND